MKVIVLCAGLSLLVLTASGIQLNSTISATADPRYALDCWKQVPVSLSLVAAQRDGPKDKMLRSSPKDPGYPGAGIKGIKKFEPYQVVLKDGFMKVACVKDEMFYHGDKFGDSRHDYNLGTRADVSIVHYEAHVPKEDRKSMTQKVCFEFCRTVPNMQFFGLYNGRQCYCAPYYRMMAGDSSGCQEVCEGDTTKMCGGKTKSSVFSMHMCASTKADLGQASSQANMVLSNLDNGVLLVKTLADKMQDAGAENQKIFGKAGDPAASDLMQEAKVFAGEMLDAVSDAEEVKGRLDDAVKEAKGLKDFTDPKTVTKAERLMEAMAKDGEASKKPRHTLGRLAALAKPGREVIGAGKQYYPLMHFVNKKYEISMQTCSGDTVDKPIVGESLDGCASACDAKIHKCVGFSYFGIGKTSLCFLFSSIKSATYYTGCPVNLLQRARMIGRSRGIKINPWQCDRIGTPLQVINADRKSRIVALDIPTGEYREVFEVKKEWTKPKFKKINACSINPIDSIIYCVMDMGRRKGFVVRIDTEKVAFVAKVKWAWAAAFDSSGNLYLSGKKFIVLPKAQDLDGVGSMFGQMPDMRKAEALVKGGMGNDVVVIEADLEGQGKRAYAIGVGKKNVLIARVSGGALKKWTLKHKGLPSHGWGAAWNFRSELYFASNEGAGVFQLDVGNIDLVKGEVQFVKAGKSMETNSNDGMGCPKGRSPFKPVLPPKPEPEEAPLERVEDEKPEEKEEEEEEEEDKKEEEEEEEEEKPAPKKGQVRCMVKFSEFQGLNLKPNPSGKCKFCLKELSRADRCY